VLRSTPNTTHGGNERIALGVILEGIKPSVRTVLAELCERWSESPPTLPLEERSGLKIPTPERNEAESPQARTQDSTASAAQEVSSVSAKRLTRRGVFEQEIVQVDEEARVVQALLGRDLSVGGMRVDPQPALQLGATLRLSIGLASDTQPVEVEARVARDDGENGVVVHFDWIEPGGKQRLRKMIATLPPIVARAPESKKRGGVFLTSVMPKLLRRRS